MEIRELLNNRNKIIYVILRKKRAKISYQLVIKSKYKDQNLNKVIFRLEYNKYDFNFLEKALDNIDEIWRNYEAMDYDIKYINLLNEIFDNFQDYLRQFYTYIGYNE